MSDMPLWNLGATALAQAFAAGRTAPPQVLDAVLARCDAVNPRLNAVVSFDLAGARDAAVASAARHREGAPLSPLDGVPLTIKDSLLAAGMRATWGSRLYESFVPEHDETPVARLRAAGAVILGKTNVPEFTVYGITDNAVFGPTRNPWNPALTPGGSSGGAVAAVAAGIGPLALCTDGGGSIRRPAAHTGLVGLKPSRDTVPRSGGFPAILHDFEVVGPVARSVADIRLAMRVLAADAAITETPRRLPPLRIAHIPQFGTAPVDPEIRASVAEAAERFAALGHRVTRLDGFSLPETLGADFPVVAETGVAWLLDAVLKAVPGAEVVPAVAAMAERGRQRGAVEYLALLRLVVEAAGQMAEIFRDVDVLLTPATAAQPWPIGTTHPETIDGRPVGPRGHAVFTAFANALGLPGLTLPARPDVAGLPIGFQLVGPQGADALLLDLGAAYEAAHGPFPMPSLD
jgi:aspartyl-tRNA(Asn)/glutamyl-tRNA(Gln) amidotransferase subunit A